MTALTPKASLRYAELTDAANAQTLAQNLATDVDSVVVPKYASTAARDAANPTPSEGDLCYLTGTGSGLHTMQRYSGAAWGRMQEAPLFVRKTADETVTSSATFQADDHLTLALAVNTTYAFQLLLITNCSTDVPDLKGRLTYPAGCEISWGEQAISFTPTTADGDGVWNAESADSTSPTNTFFVGTINGTVNGLVTGNIVVGATSGSLALEWAQNTSNGAGTVLKKGSHMMLSRVA